MKLCNRMRMVYMEFNDVNSISCSFGITFVVFISVVVPTNPVYFSSCFTLFCGFVNITIFIHEKSIAEFAFDESANLKTIWNQIGKNIYIYLCSGGTVNRYGGKSKNNFDKIKNKNLISSINVACLKLFILTTSFLECNKESDLEKKFFIYSGCFKFFS